jgi:hypothetical protein
MLILTASERGAGREILDHADTAPRAGLTSGPLVHALPLLPTLSSNLTLVRR